MHLLHLLWTFMHTFLYCVLTDIDIPHLQDCTCCTCYGPSCILFTLCLKKKKHHPTRTHTYAMRSHDLPLLIISVRIVTGNGKQIHVRFESQKNPPDITSTLNVHKWTYQENMHVELDLHVCRRGREVKKAIKSHCVVESV